jgi:GxxExxY protein
MEVTLPLVYRDMALEKAYVMDFVIEGRVIIEVKAVEKLTPIHHHQLLTYLRLSRIAAGLLINFNVRVLRDGVRRLLC